MKIYDITPKQSAADRRTTDWLKYVVWRLAFGLALSGCATMAKVYQATSNQAAEVEVQQHGSSPRSN